MIRSKQSKIENPKNKIKPKHENDTLVHKTPLGLSHLVALHKNGHITPVKCLRKNKQIQDHRPSVTLFKVALQK